MACKSVKIIEKHRVLVRQAAHLSSLRFGHVSFDESDIGGTETNVNAPKLEFAKFLFLT